MEIFVSCLIGKKKEKFVGSEGASSSTLVEFGENIKKFLIPLEEEIHLATQHFSLESRTGYGRFGTVYRGQLSESWKNRTAAFKRLDRTRGYGEHEFHNVVEMMSDFNHKNIITLIGYCDQGNEMIMVSEYANNHSLEDHLQDPNKRRSLTWARRLKICLGAAEGLKYLHSGLGEGRVVIHRNIKSSKILLDDNMEAKICGFGLSKLIDPNHLQVYEPISGVRYYLDPIYEESGILRMESDIYSFGVVLFEMLSGMLAFKEKSIGGNQPQTLINLVRCFYDDKLDELIDPDIKDTISMHSLHAFKKVAYQCISLKLEDRPTMNTIINIIEEALNIQNHHTAASAITIRSQPHQNIKSFYIPYLEIIRAIRDSRNNSLENFLIPLTEIKLATQDFNPITQIGCGGFGTVYKGELPERLPNCTVAIKRLDPKGHQGREEFRSELKFISRFHHPNIIPFVGYSDEENEMIIVYKYASNLSLDYHLENVEDVEKRVCLTWAHRLKICLGVAKGLDYLHSGQGMNNRVIHRDVKSGNILLDENMEAQICDFGLSTQGPRNQPFTQVFTKAAGTYCYLDPIYQESGILSKESDVYSFGVVLFELMSGMLAYHQTSFGDGKPQPLIELVRRYINHGPEILIDPLIKYQIGSRGFDTFIKLAYQCISLTSKESPTMDTIIDRIEDAIDLEEDWQSYLKVSRADARFNIKKALGELEKEKVYMSSNYVDFYSYAFRYYLSDEKQKSIDIESTCELLEFVLGSRFRQQVDLFIKYLRTQIDYKVVSMDQWMGFCRFCNEISFPDFNNYDEELAWPLILDNFVEWVRSNHNRNEDAIDFEGSPFL